jgi:hypothetical protein
MHASGTLVLLLIWILLVCVSAVSIHLRHRRHNACCMQHMQHCAEVGSRRHCNDNLCFPCLGHQLRLRFGVCVFLWLCRAHYPRKTVATVLCLLLSCKYCWPWDSSGCLQQLWQARSLTSLLQCHLTYNACMFASCTSLQNMHQQSAATGSVTCMLGLLAALSGGCPSMVFCHCHMATQKLLCKAAVWVSWLSLVLTQLGFSGCRFQLLPIHCLFLFWKTEFALFPHLLVRCGCPHDSQCTTQVHVGVCPQDSVCLR